MDAGKVGGACASGQKLLITGAAGFTGMHACRYFSKRGYEVAAAVRPETADRVSSLSDLSLPGVRAVVCDLANPAAVSRLVKEVQPDAVLHLAGRNAVRPSWEQPAAWLETNVMGTVYLLEAIRALGMPCRVLVAGSMIRYHWPAGKAAPKPPHPYGLSKTMQVSAALSWHALYGMDVMIAEPSNLIGPGPSTGICALITGHAVRAMKRQGRDQAHAEEIPPFRLSSRTERRDYLDVRDAVAAYGVLLQAGLPGVCYPVASGVFRSLGEIADAFDKLTGSAIHWEVGSSAAASPEPVDCSALMQMGWEPAIPFEQSLLDMLTYRKSMGEAE
ncbi:NAD-dependent epimerase/dehydratase family protein [Paenibacillus tarimensis]|uniref:NAD-dependent epimerase/dehydratase family protein n=1 Tax=Paenibacillus tarimensis TaxID=416012 RepID=UPI001F2E871C|nr:NAD-dependent epimerase/dehydratase family protein [Paenibacillus tarimensis]MCF2942995.1 NAD-dependent epimerase/dehydratase family protein [Paenibacillus tarimensis]